MPNADAYQMRTASPWRSTGYLIYAKESGEQSRDHTVRRHGYTISVRTLDVGLEPLALLNRVDLLADEIAGQARARLAA